MASDDSSLIEEVRGLTDYDEEIFTNSEFDELLGVAKEEIRADLRSPDLQFYTEDTFQATRALFWFTCIGAKVRVGEIAGIDLTIESIQASLPDVEEYQFWFQQFDKRLRSASSSQGAAVTNIERTDRTYGDT